MVKGSHCSIKKHRMPFQAAWLLTLTQYSSMKTLNLEDEERLLDEEEELETKLILHEEQLDSVAAPSLSEAS